MVLVLKSGSIWLTPKPWGMETLPSLLLGAPGGPGASVQVCSAPGTDIPVCHNSWAVSGRLPEIDSVPVKEPSKNFSVPAYRNRVNSRA